MSPASDHYTKNPSNIRIFIIGEQHLCKKYGMIVKDVDNILLIKEIHDRYDFVDAVLAITPDATEQAMYIKDFESKYPKLAEKLYQFNSNKLINMPV